MTIFLIKKLLPRRTFKIAQSGHTDVGDDKKIHPFHAPLFFSLKQIQNWFEGSLTSHFKPVQAYLIGSIPTTLIWCSRHRKLFVSTLILNDLGRKSFKLHSNILKRPLVRFRALVLVCKFWRRFSMYISQLR